jgi:hypothetical protein
VPITQPARYLPYKPTDFVIGLPCELPSDILLRMMGCSLWKNLPPQQSNVSNTPRRHTVVLHRSQCGMHNCVMPVVPSGSARTNLLRNCAKIKSRTHHNRLVIPHWRRRDYGSGRMANPQYSSNARRAGLQIKRSASPSPISSAARCGRISAAGRCAIENHPRSNE